jgi:citrate lyase subunit beta/citryl-CoA lyase
MELVRSLLSVPGNQMKMLLKAGGYGADAVIADLEDSVPVDRKAEGRSMTAEFLADPSELTRKYVRVNSIETGLLDDDLDAIVGPRLAGIQHPKTDSPETIIAVDEKLTALENARGLEPGSIEVIASIESVAGVYNCYQILSAAARVGSCVVGIAENGDLHRDVGYAHTPGGQESLYIRSKVIMDARHAGITNALDGVFSSIADMDGYEIETGRARQLGYRGKKVIHPKQIEPANRIFMPTDEEIDFHERVLAALAVAETEGSAATTVDGLMVDIAMAVNARRVLDWASEVRA